VQCSPSSYKHHCFPPANINHAIWPYFRFPPSLRLLEELPLECGIVVSNEMIRYRTRKFGPYQACRLRRKPPNANDFLHLDEEVSRIGRRYHRLCRAAN